MDEDKGVGVGGVGGAKAAVAVVDEGEASVWGLTRAAGAKVDADVGDAGGESSSKSFTEATGGVLGLNRATAGSSLFQASMKAFMPVFADSGADVEVA